MSTPRRFHGGLRLFLSGPVLWFAHFMAVYLLAEVACTAGGLPFALFGLSGLALATVVLTVAAAGLTLRYTGKAWRAWRADGGELAFLGFLLGTLFTAAILAVGVPALVLDPC